MFGRIRAIGLATLATAAALACHGLAAAQTTKSLSEEGIVKLIELQLGDEAIVAKLGKDGVSFSVDAAAIERLKTAGASEAVIEAVRKAGLARPAVAPAAAKAVTYADILNLLQLGIGEADILKRLEKSPTLFTIDAGQVEELKKAGATEALLAAMQGKRGAREASSEITDFVIILDCSASMGERTKEGPTKMAVAKQVVKDLIRKVPDGLNLAFIIYGHDKAMKCEAVSVVRPMSPLDTAASKAELSQTIDQLQPVGATPIALALRVAGEELARNQAPSGLVLISDGKETCNGNPAAEAAALVRNSKVSFGVNVIGFDVTDDERAALEEIARAGQGKYYNAETAAEFRKAVVALHKKLEREVKFELTPFVRMLMENLKDKEAVVRREAAVALGKTGPRARPAAQALVDRIADDVWNDSGSPYLIGGNDAAYDDHKNGSKDAALEALKVVAPERVEEALLLAAKSKNRHVKSWAIKRLEALSK